MVKFKVVGLSVEASKREKLAPLLGKKGRWYALVALHMSDEESKQPIAEWFYLLACSPSYAEDPFRNGPKPDERYTIVQDTLDMQGLQEIATQKVRKIKAADWDSFYKQMANEFFYEDSQAKYKRYHK